MADVAIADAVQYVLGGGGVTVAAKLFFDWWKRGQPINEQAGANVDLYNMLRGELKLLRDELRLAKRQIVILERLALKAGVDVATAYREAGVYEESDELAP